MPTTEGDAGTSTDEEAIFNKLLNMIERQLPRIVDALAPQIMELLKGKIEIQPNIQPITSTMTQAEIKQEFDGFVRHNRNFINEKLVEREKLYYTMARYECYLDLYGECLQEEPVYIPRKFRNDKYYVHSNDELNSVQKFELQRFQSECEIFRIRRDNTTNEIFAIDKEVSDLIAGKEMSREAKELAEQRYTKCIGEDIFKVDQKWEKKIKGVRTAYINDQERMINNPRFRQNTLPTQAAQPTFNSQRRNVNGNRSGNTNISGINSNNININNDRDNNSNGSNNNISSSNDNRGGFNSNNNNNGIIGDNNNNISNSNNNSNSNSNNNSSNSNSNNNATITKPLIPLAPSNTNNGNDTRTNKGFKPTQQVDGPPSKRGSQDNPKS